MGALKPHSNDSLYSNTMIGTLAVDGGGLLHFGTAHPSTASVRIIVLLYNGSLLCGFNAPIKG